MKYSYEHLIQDISDGLYFVDRQRRITFWNKAAETITGYTAREVIGKRCMDNILVHVDSDGNSLCKGKCPLAKTMTDGRTRGTEVFLHHKDGHRVPVMVRVTPLKDGAGRIIGGAELFTDISPLQVMRSKIAELEQLALIDALTGLSNRAHMEGAIEARLKEFHRYGLCFGILFMDIDHFKSFNDRYGHDVGDKVLKTVGNTLSTTARAFDQYGRWGGEEFIGIIRNVDNPALVKTANRCRVLIRASQIAVGDQRLNVTVSIGATLVRPDDTEERLVKRADRLMYESKQSGRDFVTLE